jgi:hypothetical protein
MECCTIVGIHERLKGLFRNTIQLFELVMDEYLGYTRTIKKMDTHFGYDKTTVKTRIQPIFVTGRAKRPSAGNAANRRFLCLETRYSVIPLISMNMGLLGFSDLLLSLGSKWIVNTKLDGFRW